MPKVKASPAVVTALTFITTLTLILLILLVPAPARAVMSGPDAAARATLLGSQSSALHDHVARLAKQVRRGHRGPAVKRSILRVNRSILSLNRSLATLSRTYLSLDECDTESLESVLTSNSSGLNVAKDTLRLDRRMRARTTTRAYRRVSKTAVTLASLTSQLRHKRWPKPATPTPTATTPTVPAGYTLVQNQTINNLATGGLHHRYYYRCAFTGGSATSAVLSFTGSSYNLVFDTCTIARGGGWNGVTINDAYGAVHDITFKSTLFKAQGRMGFECTSRPTSATTQYQRIDIIDSTFEPQGNEAVSYDGGGAAGSCTFSGNTIQGAGNDPAQPFDAGLEVNGPSNFTVTNNVIWQTRGPALNLQRHVTDPCGWVVSGNLLDASHRYQATAQSSSSQQVLSFNVYGGSFASNTIISAAPGGSVAYLSGSHGMDWRTSTWRDAGGRSAYNVPRLADGSAGNLF